MTVLAMALRCLHGRGCPRIRGRPGLGIGDRIRDRIRVAAGVIPDVAGGREADAGHMEQPPDPATVPRAALPPPTQAPWRPVRAKAGPLGGVCGALAVATGVDVTLVRLAFVAGALSGFGVIAYGVLWLVMPREDRAGRAPTPAPPDTARWIRARPPRRRHHRCRVVRLAPRLRLVRAVWLVRPLRPPRLLRSRLLLRPRPARGRRRGPVDAPPRRSPVSRCRTDYRGRGVGGRRPGRPRRPLTHRPPGRRLATTARPPAAPAGRPRRPARPGGRPFPPASWWRGCSRGWPCSWPSPRPS